MKMQRELIDIVEIKKWMQELDLKNPADQIKAIAFFNSDDRIMIFRESEGEIVARMINYRGDDCPFRLTFTVNPLLEAPELLAWLLSKDQPEFLSFEGPIPYMYFIALAQILITIGAIWEIEGGANGVWRLPKIQAIA